MSVLIQFSEALKSYGKQPILDGASVQFSTSDKMGLIGCNGSGKSTLCKLILGGEELDGGRLKRALRCGWATWSRRTPSGRMKRFSSFSSVTAAARAGVAARRPAASI